MSLERDGFAVVPLLEPGEVLALRGDITSHLDRFAGALLAGLDYSEPEAPFAERLERVAQRDQSYANLLRIAVCTDAHRAGHIGRLPEHAAVKAATEPHLGGPPRQVIMRVAANIPTLAEERHGWHSDVAVDDGADCTTVKLTCWLPLMDAGPKSGGLEVIPGRRARPLPHLKAHRRFEIPEEHLEGLTAEPIHCPMGSAILLDRFTPHRATPNHTGAARWSVVMWMKSAA